MDVALGDSGDLGSASTWGMAGLDDLGGLFQPKSFHDCMKTSLRRQYLLAVCKFPPDTAVLSYCSESMVQKQLSCANISLCNKRKGSCVAEQGQRSSSGENKDLPDV